jgi:hypothetical protein
MKKVLSFFLLVSLYLFLVTPVSAIYFKKGDNLHLTSDKQFDETVFVSGNKVIIDSNINGDLFCAGQDITINGTITGDIFCAGQNLKVTGEVVGSIRMAGQNITLSSQISRNVLATGQNVALTDTSSTQGDVFAAGQTILISGPVGRDVGIAGADITVASSIGGDAHLAGSNLSVSSLAKIDGNLDYYVDTNSTVSIADQSVVGLSTKHFTEVKPPVDTAKTSRKVSGGFWFYSLISGIVLALVLLYISPSFTLNSAHTLAKNPLITFLVGLAVLIVTPIAFIVLLMTVVGVPLAFIVLLLYIIGLMTSLVYSSLALGRWLFAHINYQGSDYLALIAGMVVFRLVCIIPFLGWFIGLIMLCLGLGAYFQNFLPPAKSPSSPVSKPKKK